MRTALRKWIVDRARGPARDLADDTPILESGLLSSLDVVELIVFIEGLRGNEVDVETIEPEALTSIDTLYLTFFQGRNA